MKPSLFASIVMLAGIGGLPALPLRGQISWPVDAQGRRIFTNRARRVPQGRTAAGRGAGSRASRSGLETIVERAAERHGIDPEQVRAVVRTESGWNSAAISPKGAEGLMQLLPATAERFGVRNVFDPAENVERGVRYLHKLVERYRGNLEQSLAGYYADEQAIERAGGVPNDPATRAYVRRVSHLCFTGASEPAFRARSFPIHRVVDAGRVVYTNE